MRGGGGAGVEQKDPLKMVRIIRTGFHSLAAPREGFAAGSKGAGHLLGEVRPLARGNSRDKMKKKGVCHGMDGWDFA